MRFCTVTVFCLVLVSSARCQLQLQGHKGAVNAIAFSPDGKTLATAGDDNTVRLWDVATGKQRFLLEGHPGPVRSVAFAPDGKTLASGGYRDSVKLWDPNTGVLRSTLPGTGRRSAIVSGLAFTPQGTTLIGAIGWSVHLLSSRCMLSAWNVTTGQLELQQPIGVTTQYPAIALTPDGSTLAMPSGRAAIFFDAATAHQRGQSLSFPSGFGATALAMSADGTVLALAGMSRTGPPEVMVWHLGSNNLLATLKGHTDKIESLALDHSGALLASGSWDGTVKLWNVTSASQRNTLQGSVGPIHSVALSPDGKTLAAGGRNGTVEIWKLP